MYSEDLKFEELQIAEAVGLAFHGFDFVVHSFEGSGRDAAVVVRQDAVAMLLEGGGNARKYNEGGLYVRPRAASRFRPRLNDVARARRTP